MPVAVTRIENSGENPEGPKSKFKGHVQCHSRLKSDLMARVDKEGVISTLLDAGCFICAPSCGMCPGFYTPLAKDEVCIASTTTNYPGRMGDESAQVYLGSPATVAASAIEGKITDPRKYL